jgi:hypothetical protein
MRKFVAVCGSAARMYLKYVYRMPASAQLFFNEQRAPYMDSDGYETK